MGIGQPAVGFASKRWAPNTSLGWWVLDWIAHRPDMPILPHGPYVGLGLWNYPLAGLCVEPACSSPARSSI